VRVEEVEEVAEVEGISKFLETTKMKNQGGIPGSLVLVKE